MLGDEPETSVGSPGTPPPRSWGTRFVARGVWTPPHQITLVRGYEDNEITVRHEMLHDLLEGDSEHRSPLWTECDLIPG